MTGLFSIGFIPNRVLPTSGSSSSWAMSIVRICLLVATLNLFYSVCDQAPAFTRQYEMDKVYSYSYETEVLLNEPQKLPESVPKDVGFRVQLDVDLIPLWQSPTNEEQIFELKVAAPQLSVKAREGPIPTNFVRKTSRLDQIKSFPFYFVRNDSGIIVKVFFHEKEDLSLLNMKKGIASLFQYQSTKDEKRIEVDASGSCAVSYSLQNRNHFMKTKQNCQPVQEEDFYQHAEQVLGASISSEASTTLELHEEDTSLKVARTFESHRMRPEARNTSGVQVIASHLLSFKEKRGHKNRLSYGSTTKSAIEAISKSIKSSLAADSLASKPEPKECIACKTLKELIWMFRKSLEPSSIATQGSAIAFIRILRKMRVSSHHDIKMSLADKKNKQIFLQLVDIVAATQTLESHKAASEVIRFDREDILAPERYLIGLALNTHPLQFAIEDLLKLSRKGVKNQKLQETLVLTLGTMTKTFAANNKGQRHKIVSDVDKHLEQSLLECKTEKCQLMFVRALKNRQSRDTVELLLAFAKGPSRKTAIYSMRALQTFPQHFIVSKVLSELRRILFELDVPHDSSVRAMAAEILLRGPPQESLLSDIFQMVSQGNASELNTLLLGQIADLSDKNIEFSEAVRGVVRAHQFHNYHVWSQGGLSSAFSRPLVQSSAVNASFTNMLEIKGGLLKRSTVDVFLSKEDHSTPILSFGMFAGGLSMFGGDEDDSDDEEANAGIEISLLGSQLRPFVFFAGQGELMGHVMGGTASSRTTAIQGSMLLQDHNQRISLQNGLNVNFLLTGVASYDFAGQVAISLWYRNANSLVEVGSAAVVQGVARVDNNFVQTMVEFNVGSQAQLNFDSKLDFSDEVMMCLQMTQPDVEVIDNVRKLERIPGSTYVLRKYKRKTSTIPGKTYVMNRKNTEICTAMNPPDGH